MRREDTVGLRTDDFYRSKNADAFFSCFGFGEVADLDELKGIESPPSGLKILRKSKNPLDSSPV